MYAIASVFQATNCVLFFRFHTSHIPWKYSMTSWADIIRCNIYLILPPAIIQISTAETGSWHKYWKDFLQSTSRYLHPMAFHNLQIHLLLFHKHTVTRFPQIFHYRPQVQNFACPMHQHKFHRGNCPVLIMWTVVESYGHHLLQ